MTSYSILPRKLLASTTRKTSVEGLSASHKSSAILQLFHRFRKCFFFLPWSTQMSSTHPIPSAQPGSSCVAGTWSGNSISPEGPLSSKAIGDEREEGSGVASTPRSPPKALLQPPPPRPEPAPCKRYGNWFRWQRATISRQCKLTNYKSRVQTSPATPPQLQLGPSRRKSEEMTPFPVRRCRAHPWAKLERDRCSASPPSYK